ncbi:MAG: hypothetical protein VYA67_22055 [Actinomycetota bacterium]|nr:hypothetical protein [Actinomycetota bacterium]
MKEPPRWLWPVQECTHPPEYRITDQISRDEPDKQHCAACGATEFPPSSQPESSQP